MLVFVLVAVGNRVVQQLVEDDVQLAAHLGIQAVALGERVDCVADPLDFLETVGDPQLEAVRIGFFRPSGVENTEYGDVVCLLGVTLKGPDIVGPDLDRLLDGGKRLRRQQVLQPLLGIELVVDVHRFRDAIRVEEDQVAGRESHKILLVRQPLSRADDRAVALVDADELAARSLEVGRVVARVAVGQLASTQVENREKHRHEHARLVALASSVLTWLRMLAGERSLAARDLINVLVTAMNNAAGTPFPDTSPTQKQKWLSSIRKRS